MAVDAGRVLKDIQEEMGRDVVISRRSNEYYLGHGGRYVTAYTVKEVDYWIMKYVRITDRYPPHYGSAFTIKEKTVCKEIPTDWTDTRNKVCRWLFQGLL